LIFNNFFKKNGKNAAVHPFIKQILHKSGNIVAYLKHKT